MDISPKHSSIQQLTVILVGNVGRKWVIRDTRLVVTYMAVGTTESALGLQFNKSKRQSCAIGCVVAAQNGLGREKLLHASWMT